MEHVAVLLPVHPAVQSVVQCRRGRRRVGKQPRRFSWCHDRPPNHSQPAGRPASQLAATHTRRRPDGGYALRSGTMQEVRVVKGRRRDSASSSECRRRPERRGSRRAAETSDTRPDECTHADAECAGRRHRRGYQAQASTGCCRRAEEHLDQLRTWTAADRYSGGAFFAIFYSSSASILGFFTVLRFHLAGLAFC